ncbi:MAG TPA: MATE family efflux transporter [Vicinamibacterales bacterium]|jgi:putative MATE family efflux protein|nr:MATE family efflux transporter [Vicinamibacterales bacterium]
MADPAPKPAQTFDRSIVEGPIVPAVWRLAWPTMLQNAIAGLQGIIDHVMVGHFVGTTANAAIGVSWQIIIVVIVFISSLFTGMAVLVARFAGANDPEKVNRVVYQAFLTAFALSALLAAIGYSAAPTLLDSVNAAPEVQAEALPFLRAMFVGIFGLLMFFMLSGAFRAAGDPRTPLRLGVTMTVLTIVFNVILIPVLGTVGAALGTIASSTIVAVYGVRKLFAPGSVIHFHGGLDKSPDWSIIRSLFRFGLPAGVQGIAMNIAGVLLIRFIGSLEHSAAAQAVYAVGYTELFSLITWTSVGLMGASATIAGQNLGAGNPERAKHGVAVAARIGLAVAAVVGAMFLLVPQVLLGAFSMTDPVVASLGEQLLRYLSVSGLFITVALSYTGGLQGTGDTRSPLYISVISQIGVPIGLCTFFQATGILEASEIWMAIVLGHLTRAVLSIFRFRQGRWRDIAVDV